MASDSRDVIREWYAGEYGAINATANGSLFDRYTHDALERGIPLPDRFPTVLEVGANRGEHFHHVKHSFDRYVVTDLGTPDLLPAVAADPRVETLSCDVSALPFADGSFDRVIVTCVFHHVDSPLDAALEIRRVLRPGGLASILVPNDPGLAYRAGKSLTTRRAARRAGVAQASRLVDAIGHHNHFRSIRIQLHHAFEGDDERVTWYPFRFPSVELNAFTVWQVHRAGHSIG